VNVSVWARRLNNAVFDSPHSTVTTCITREWLILQQLFLISNHFVFS
jgi:hypothetical protein